MSKITPQNEDYSNWYNDVVEEAGLAEHAPVRGCMVIKPYGYALWENIKTQLDIRLKETGHVNAYFPVFIPMSFLQKEAQHVEGFSPELAVVTHGGGKELEEPLVVRPTSETIIGHMYAKWIQSYRDLPLLINQWANVVRWEMRPRLFLRTTEFLWQEGHTAHATAEEAQEEALRMLNVYADFAEREAAIPVIKGRKSETEKFAGAVTSYSLEAMMGNHWALQAATSHFLGTNFAQAFDIKFTDKENISQYCWTTSWGMSTRMVGAIIMTHGDDKGLVLPPRLAPVQVVVVPIWANDEQKATVMEYIQSVLRALDGMRVEVDLREGLTPGWKFNEWEMKGVPTRIEVGPRDVENGQVVLARRDVPGRGGKSSVPISDIRAHVDQLLESVQGSLYERALSRLQDNTFDVQDYASLCDAVGKGFARGYWCGAPEDEARLKEDTKATSRCIPLDQEPGQGQHACIICGRPATQKSIFARAY